MSQREIVLFDDNLSLDDWIRENKEFISEETGDIRIDENGQEVYNYESLAMLHEDEKQFQVEALHSELKRIDQVKGNIIAFADLGLWNGRVVTYKDLDTTDVSDCLCSFAKSGNSTIRLAINEQGQLTSAEYHHDGVNYYQFMELDPTLTAEKREEAYEAFEGLDGLDSKDEQECIAKYCNSIGEIIIDKLGLQPVKEPNKEIELER